MLPKPDGLLALSMPSSAIEAANNAVREIIAKTPID